MPQNELWREKWWLSDEYTRVYGERVTPEKMDQAIVRVAEVFDSAWAAKTPRHPAYYWILPTGLMPLQFLYGLGRDLLEVGASLRLPSVVKDLRDPFSFESARFELEIAAYLRTCGHLIEFRPALSNGKSSDVLATFGEERVYIEIKSLQESQIQLALNDLTRSIAFAVSDLTRETSIDPIRGKGYSIELDGSLSNLFGNGIDVDRRIIEVIKNQILNEIQSRAASGASLDFDLPSVARVRIGGVPEGSFVNCPRAPSVAELKRIVNGRIQEAIQQLHTDYPGIVIFKTAGGLELEITEVILQGLISHFGPAAKHLSAVIFFPEYFGLLTAWARFHPFVVSNTNAAAPVAGLKAYEHLKQLLAVEVKTTSS